MNNRYLWRAKRIDNGEWVEGNLIYSEDIDDNYKAIIIPISNSTMFTRSGSKGYLGFEEWQRVDPSTICQCTGLKDKNGKLIWENDILDGHIKRGAAFYRCIVLWNECNARFDVRAMECNFPMTLDECCDDISISGFDYEDIGNIFDNPDIVEE